MPLLSLKHKFRSPANTDPATIWTYFKNLADDVDNKLPQGGMPYFGKPYVHSGGGITGTAGLGVSVGAGTANIGGITFTFATTALTLTASATQRIWLTATFDTNGFLASHAFSVRTDVTVPANSVLIGDVATNATVPTAIYNTFRGVIAPGGRAGFTQISSNGVAPYVQAAGSAGLLTASSITVVGDGVTPIRVFGDCGRIDGNTVGGTTQLYIDQAGVGTIGSDNVTVGFAGANMAFHPRAANIAAFVGARTYTIGLYSLGGQSIIQAGVVVNHEIQWAF